MTVTSSKYSWCVFKLYKIAGNLTNYKARERYIRSLFMKAMAFLIPWFRIFWITISISQRCPKSKSLLIISNLWDIAQGDSKYPVRVYPQGNKCSLQVAQDSMCIHSMFFWTLMQKNTINSKGNCIENCTICQKEHTSRLSRLLILTQCQLLLEISVLQDVTSPLALTQEKKKIISSENKRL